MLDEIQEEAAEIHEWAVAHPLLYPQVVEFCLGVALPKEVVWD